MSTFDFHGLPLHADLAEALTMSEHEREEQRLELLAAKRTIAKLEADPLTLPAIVSRAVDELKSWQDSVQQAAAAGTQVIGQAPLCLLVVSTDVRVCVNTS